MTCINQPKNIYSLDFQKRLELSLEAALVALYGWCQYGDTNGAFFVLF